MTVEETVEAQSSGPVEVPPPATAAAKRQRQKDTSTYVLQIAYDVETGEGDGAVTETAWFDAATVTVPAGTKRSTVRARALEEWGEVPALGAPPLRTRLLDEDSAEETPVDSELQLRIGGAS